MKIDKYSAILGSSIGFAEMKGLTDTRPLANLPFDGKYRLIDFQLSNLANAGVRSIYGIFVGKISAQCLIISGQVVNGGLIPY